MLCELELMKMSPNKHSVTLAEIVDRPQALPDRQPSAESQSGGWLIRFVVVSAIGVLLVGLAAAGAFMLAVKRGNADSNASQRRETPTVAAVIAAQDTPKTDSHPLDPALKIARENLEYIQGNVRDYTSIVIKRERINGTLGETEFCFCKIRNRKMKDGKVEVPLSVYMKFLKPKSVMGREAIWVENQYDGKLIAHDNGFKNLLTVRLDPRGYWAMLGQKYDITEMGIENLVVELLDRGQRERKYNECDVQFFEGAKVGERKCMMIQVTHPEQREHFEFYIAQIFIDQELNVPIRYAAFSWPETEGGEPVLLEEYTYTDIKLNVGLTDKDFDPTNPEYNFP